VTKKWGVQLLPHCPYQAINLGFLGLVCAQFELDVTYCSHIV